MKKILSLISFFYLFAILAGAQDDDFLKKQLQFLGQIKGSYEGFQTSDCKSVISYHSLRNDITDGLLTRATNGSMEIGWQTQAIPNYFKADGAWFVWLAAIDITDKKVNFDVFIDNVKRFTFPSGKRTSWSYTNPDGGILKYQSFDSDQHGDSHGYMTLYAPKSWLKSGKPLEIKIVGEAAGENTWVIVFKAGDIISYLEKLTEYQLWLDVSISVYQGKNDVIVTAPANLAGQKLFYISGEQKGSVLLKRKDDISTAQFNLKGDMKNQKFIISDKNSELLYLENLKKDTLLRKLLSQAVLINELTIKNNQYNAKSRRLYKPKTVKSILVLNSSKLSKGKIYLMNSSHQDIAWMDS
ncbi:MAG: hypothetical protein DRJ10_19060, partial [Bacteroidetes bacterium]